MAFSFKSLLDFVTGKGQNPAAKLGNATREKIRKTAADEYQARIAKRQPLAAPQPQTPQERFLAGIYKLTIGIDFQSSNPKKPAVYQVWYVPGQQEIYVTFFDHKGKGPMGHGPTYKYWTITIDEARSMYVASSKGIEIWNSFRVRGSRIAHKKNYALV